MSTQANLCPLKQEHAKQASTAENVDPKPAPCRTSRSRKNRTTGADTAMVAAGVIASSTQRNHHSSDPPSKPVMEARETEGVTPCT